MHMHSLCSCNAYGSIVFERSDRSRIYERLCSAMHATGERSRLHRAHIRCAGSSRFKATKSRALPQCMCAHLRAPTLRVTLAHAHAHVREHDFGMMHFHFCSLITLTHASTHDVRASIRIYCFRAVSPDSNANVCAVRCMQAMIEHGFTECICCTGSSRF